MTWVWLALAVVMGLPLLVGLIVVAVVWWAHQMGGESFIVPTWPDNIDTY